MNAKTLLGLIPCLVALGGCSLSGAVTRSSLDYAQVLETVSDDMLATNILLARDRAPLHFTDLSQIRGSLQLQAQTSVSEPFGSLYNSDEPPRAMLNGMIAGATNPTFDVVPLNTKSFTEGINAPIDPKFYQYLTNGEQDDGASITIPKLFFAKVRLVWKDGTGLHGCSYFNSVSRSVPPDDAECAAEARTVFGDGSSSSGIFDLVATALQSDAYYVKKPSDVIGRDVRLSGSDLLRGAPALATQSLSLHRDLQGLRDDGRYTLARERKDGVYCWRTPSRVDGSPRSSRWMVLNIANLTDPVDAEPVEDPAGICSGRPAADRPDPALPRFYIYIRSVEGIFQYLGRMLTLDPSERALPFFIDETRPKHPRFGIDYRGRTYYVAESADPCSAHDPASPPSSGDGCRDGAKGLPGGYRRRDETLLILSILNQLLDLYKNSSDIPITPAVQAVP